MEQRSKEWYKAREGRITASKAKILLGRNGLGKMAEDYANELVYSSYLIEIEEQHSTYAMKLGVELEPFAIAKFEEEELLTVSKVGFVTKGDDLGCSPDGLIDSLEGLEVKCPQAKTHFNNITSKEVPSDYIDQIQFSLYVTGRVCWYLVSYNPNFKDGLDYKCWTIKVDEKWVTKFESRLVKFRVMVEEAKVKLNKQLDR